MFKKRVKGHHIAGLKSKQKPMPLNEDRLSELLSKNPDHEDGVIYFHVPYCDKICSFCNMNRTKLVGELEEYTEYLLKEIKFFSSFSYMQQKKFESIYFGGGTPTILKANQLERIIKAINRNFNVSKTCEFNFESTLHNLSLQKVKLMQDLGVNRYSIGVQTFGNNGRKLLNRTGSKEKTVEKLLKIREIFKGNMCIDIIYNYPEQTLEEVLEDARLTKKVGADSVSFYSLMFQEGSILDGSIDSDYYDLETDKKFHDVYLNTMLEDDYEILEITKINKINKDQYKYIRLGHKGIDILPIGVGAGGSLAGYSGFSPKKGMHFFTKTDEVSKKLKLFNSLFQYPKTYFDDMKKYINDNTFENIYGFLKEVEKHGYITLDKESTSYTRDGIFWGNTIASEILKITLKEFE